MEGLVQPLRPFLSWLWQTTLTASLVICLILVAQKVLARRLGPRWAHTLWLVLLVRMVMPWAPPSRVSLLHLLPPSVRQGQLPALSTRPERSPDLSLRAGPELAGATAQQEIVTEPSAPRALPPEPKARPDVAPAPRTTVATLRRILTPLWLAGAALVGLQLFVSNFSLWRIVKRERPAVDQTLLELFEGCKTLMGVQALVAVIPTSGIECPALFGFLRPRLLLPRSLLDTAGRNELRYAFLHELAHLKRHDIYLGWIASLLQVLHWFNPLVWLAFHRMRLDRELACDALVLARTGPQESREYGQAIVALLRRFSRSQSLPALAGVLENQAQLKRRIAMITQFQNHSYRWSLTAVITLLAVACLAAPGANQGAAINDRNSAGPTSEPKGPMTMRLVQKEIEDHVSVSPDGKHLCGCGTWAEAGDGIVIGMLATGARHTIKPAKSTQQESGPQYPVLSPDNKTIAYYVSRDNVGRADLCLIAADGSGQRVLYPGVMRSLKKAAKAGPPLQYPGLVKPVQWFPEGSRLLCLRWRDPMQAFTEIEIVSISTADRSLEVIETLTGDFFRTTVRLSPDGKYVAYEVFSTDAPTKHDIFAIEIGSKQATPLIVHAADDRLLGWTPDGKHILLLSDRAGSWSTWLLPFAQGQGGGTPELVARSTGDIKPVGFAENGSYYYRMRYSAGDIYTAMVNLTTGQLLSAPAPLEAPGSNGVADWSPDGKYLAYGSHPTTTPEPRVIRIRSLATGTERELANPLTDFTCLRWSPDGRSLLVSGLLAYRPEDALWPSRVCRIDVATGESTILLEEKNNHTVMMAELSPDGSILFYNTGLVITRREIATGQEKEIFKYTAKAPWAAWALSPDGKSIAAGCNEGRDENQSQGWIKKILLITAQDGQVTELLRWNDSAGYLTNMSWSPEGRNVLFTVHQNEKQTDEFWQVPTAGGDPRKIVETKSSMGRPYGLRVHPDGRRLVFSESVVHGELWVMENFLPAGTGQKESR